VQFTSWRVPVPFSNVMRGVTTFAAAGAAGHTNYQVGRIDPETQSLFVREGNRKALGCRRAMCMP
jgi:hypothetical protein